MALRAWRSVAPRPADEVACEAAQPQRSAKSSHDDGGSQARQGSERAAALRREDPDRVTETGQEEEKIHLERLKALGYRSCKQLVLLQAGHLPVFMEDGLVGSADGAPNFVQGAEPRHAMLEMRNEEPWIHAVDGVVSLIPSAEGYRLCDLDIVAIGRFARLRMTLLRGATADGGADSSADDNTSPKHPGRGTLETTAEDALEPAGATAAGPSSPKPRKKRVTFDLESHIVPEEHSGELPPSSIEWAPGLAPPHSSSGAAGAAAAGADLTDRQGTEVTVREIPSQGPSERESSNSEGRGMPRGLKLELLRSDGSVEREHVWYPQGINDVLLVGTSPGCGLQLPSSSYAYGSEAEVEQLLGGPDVPTSRDDVARCHSSITYKGWHFTIVDESGSEPCEYTRITGTRPVHITEWTSLMLGSVVLHVLDASVVAPQQTAWTKLAFRVTPLRKSNRQSICYNRYPSNFTVLSRGQHTIGRSPLCDVLVRDYSLKPMHMQVFSMGGVFFVETLVNSRATGVYILLGREPKIERSWVTGGRGPQILSLGSVIRAGATEFLCSLVRVETPEEQAHRIGRLAEEVEFLRNLPWLQAIPHDTAVSMASCLQKIALLEGDTVPCDHSERLFFVKEGTIVAFGRDSDSGTSRCQLLSVGTAFMCTSPEAEWEVQWVASEPTTLVSMSCRTAYDLYCFYGCKLPPPPPFSKTSFPALLFHLLSSYSILSELTLSELAHIVVRFSELHLVDDEIIIREGDSAEGDDVFFYLVVEGELEVMSSTTFCSLTPGHHAGEMSLLSGKPRNATVKSRGNTCLACLDKAAFGSLLKPIFNFVRGPGGVDAAETLQLGAVSVGGDTSEGGGEHQMGGGRRSRGGGIQTLALSVAQAARSNALRQRRTFAVPPLPEHSHREFTFWETENDLMQRSWDRMGGASSVPYGLVLSATSGPMRGRDFVIRDRCIIGTDPNCTASLSDRLLSEHNTLVEYRDGRFWVRDLCSKHGTLLKLRVGDELSIFVGDTYIIGNTELTAMARLRSDTLYGSASSNCSCAIA